MKIAVLYVTKNELVAIYPDKGQQKLTKKWSWTSENIEAILKELLAINTHWAVLLSPRVSYFKTIEKKEAVSRLAIAGLLPKLIPEVLVERQWDWKKDEAGKCFVEAVTGVVWQWIVVGEKLGLIWEEITTTKYVTLSAKIEPTNIQGMLQFVMTKHEIRGRDENVLNITVEAPKTRSPLHIVITVFVAVLFVSLLFFGGWWLIQNKPWSSHTSPTNSIVQPTIVPTPEPTVEPTPAAFLPENFNMRVENGTAIAGEASRIGALMEEAGFVVIQKGNASRKYTQTIVHSKVELPVTIRAIISDVLNKKEVVYQTDLLTDDENEIIVSIGK